MSDLLDQGLGLGSIERLRAWGFSPTCVLSAGLHIV